MDEGFLRDRLLYIRKLAENADPFIKKRLLDLAAAYERRPGLKPKALVNESAKVASEQT